MPLADSYDYNSGNYLNTPATAYPLNGVTVTGSKPATMPGNTGASGDSAFTNLITGENLNGLANIIGAFTGKGGTQYATGTPTPAAASGSSTWLIIGGLVVAGILAYFLFKKD